jgi:hypothetical protein
MRFYYERDFLMLFQKLINVYDDNHTKIINTFKVIAGGASVGSKLCVF